MPAERTYVLDQAIRAAFTGALFHSTWARSCRKA
jgi:hypothetical protein